MCKRTTIKHADTYDSTCRKADIKGIAPILTATLDGAGNFLSGEIVSTVQLPPSWPSIDKEQRALKLLRGLSVADFGTPGLLFQADGQLLPAKRLKLIS